MYRLGRLNTRMIDPAKSATKTIVNNFSSPNLSARRGAKDEQNANIINGILVKIPNEFTETPKPSATSLRTVGIVVKGIRITAPTRIIPGTKKIELSFFM